MRRIHGAFAALLVIGVLWAASPSAQQRYETPPAPIDAILARPSMPTATLSPDRASLLLIEGEGNGPVADLLAPMVSMAGRRIDPRSNGPHGSRAVYTKSVKVVSLNGGAERTIELPAGRIAEVTWSPDSSRVSFTVTSDRGIALWVADARTGKSRSLTGSVLNGAAYNMGGACVWAPKSDALLCRTVVSDRGAAPTANTSGDGPIIQTADGKPAPTWTFTDLLKSPLDERRLDYYFTSQLARVSLDGKVTPFGKPGTHTRLAWSPSGAYVLVQTIHRPYSYRVELPEFPHKSEVWDATGKVVRQVADAPLNEVPLGANAFPAGPRQVSWRPDVPATVVWVESMDGGRPDSKMAKRDRLFSLEAPFSGSPVTLAETEFRIGVRFASPGGLGVAWVRPDLAFLNESWGPTQRVRVWAFDPSTPSKPHQLVNERSSRDRYNDPGAVVMVPSHDNSQIVLTTKDGRYAFRTGAGASPEGERPFLDRLDLTTMKAERVWRSEAPYYEQPVFVLDPDAPALITRRESVKEPPNYYARRGLTSAPAAITRFADPVPELAGVQPQLITYARADGVQLSARLYLPPGYDKSKGPLPFLVWAYPAEFKDAAAAAQVKGSAQRFVRPNPRTPDHLFLLTQGYGILDDPAIPIIGEGETEPNDSYVKQLVAGAQAAVDKIVSMGVADRSRIAIGGHSYGGFMTGNLLVHSDLFKTGIARSPAYNRTLTPFGFQNESRHFWRARDTYIQMSPFSHADKLNEPVLMIHGEIDSNPGTFPIHSMRMFEAIKGLGGRARFVLLPGEDHGYRARESVGHVLWEMVTWLDAHLKTRSGTSTSSR
jgi:dipeptidyl aminopeptidase/acylaminoacyl peptidase